MVSIKRKKYLIPFLLISLIVIAISVLYFEPHKIFIDDKTNEEQVGSIVTGSTKEVVTQETSISTTTTTLPSKSMWRTREHETSGDVFVTSDGNINYLRFENLSTSNGPDLKVYIAKQLEDNGTPIDFINLGDLKGNIGNANYEVPSNVDLKEYKYVVIWCKRFSASFADAEIII